MPDMVMKKDVFIIYFLLSGILFAIMACPLSAYAWGQGEMCGTGPVIGRGMHRGYGFSPGPGSNENFAGPFGRGGLNLQRGILREPTYCKMILDRQDLNLTPEQREALRKLQINHIKATLPIRSDLQINKIELRKLRFAKDPDFTLIKAKLENISKLQLELQINRVKLQLDADKLLTQEQKDSLYLSPDMAVDVEWDEAVDVEEMPRPGTVK